MERVAQTWSWSHGTGFVPWAFPGHGIMNPRHESHAVATSWGG